MAFPSSNMVPQPKVSQELMDLVVDCVADSRPIWEPHEYTMALRNLRLAGRAFASHARKRMFQCVKVRGTPGSKRTKKLLDILGADEALVSCIKELDITLPLTKDVKDLVLLLCLLTNHPSATCHTLKVRFDFLGGREQDFFCMAASLEEAVLDLVFSGRLKRLELEGIHHLRLPFPDVLLRLPPTIHSLRITKASSRLGYDYPDPLDILKSTEDPSLNVRWRDRFAQVPVNRIPSWKTLTMDVTSLKVFEEVDRLSVDKGEPSLLGMVEELHLLHPPLDDREPIKWNAVDTIFRAASLRSLSLSCESPHMLGDLISLHDFKRLETFSLCLYTGPDRGRDLVNIATLAIKSFFLLPSSHQCESLSKIYLRIEGEAIGFSYDVFHTNLASHLIEPIFELSDDGERLRYRKVKELHLEITCRRSMVPHLDKPIERAVFGPRRTLAYPGTTTTHEHWAHSLPSDPPSIFQRFVLEGRNGIIWAVVIPL